MYELHDKTPAADGFRMPAEWEPHRGCWLIWPENAFMWREGAKPAQRALASVANAIAATGEQVTVAVSAAQYFHARSRLTTAVRVVEMRSHFAWARDLVPTFVVDDRGGLRGVDWPFNGYGNRYPHWQYDAGLAGRVLDLERLGRYRAPLVVEGGAFHVDGAGTCLTTEECLLHPNRNGPRERAELEAVLAEQLAVRAVVWLPSGLVSDETDGHVDNLACFTGPGVVCLLWTDDENDPQYERCAAAEEVLAGASDATGRPLRVVRMPMPGPLYMTDEEAEGRDRGGPGGTRLPASYCNFYLANGAVLMPEFGVDTDADARRVMAGLFPDREIIALPTREILLGGGNLHCATQQVPLAGTG